MSSQSKDNLPPAIVLGMDDIRGVHAARTLAAHGIPVIGVANDKSSYACRTNVCQQILVADSRTDEFVPVLEDVSRKLSQRAVLVPCTDMAALQVSRHRGRLTGGYIITLPAADVVETLMDKVNFYQYAERAGLPVPTTCYLLSRSDVEAAAERLQFPCAVKPPNSKSPRWLEHTSAKAFRITDVEELRRCYDQHSKIATPLVAQNWIEGPETELYACHCYLDADSNPLASFTSRKLRQWPPQTGQGSLAEEVQNDTVRKITLDLFRSIGFRGLGYVEVKRDTGTGEYLIVEPNIGRVSGRMAIAEAGGVELLHTMYCDAAGLPLPENREQKFIGAKWIYLRQDLQSSLVSMLRRELGLFAWWRSLRGHKKFALWSWKDPGPFFGDIASGVRQLIFRRKTKKQQPPAAERFTPPNPAAQLNTHSLETLKSRTAP